jgi:hypothetical protein
MFVQVIEGRTKDPDGMKRQSDRWQSDVRPGAIGYLGVTAGTAPDGRSIALVRFESEEAARANSERPEQSAWFEEMQKYWDGEPSFTESSEVEEFMGGGNDKAGFVQIMKSNDVDRAKLARMDQEFEKVAHMRPDLIGMFRVWTGPNSCLEAAYFSSEAEARAGEKAEIPADVQALMAEFEDMNVNTEFIDLPDPQIH